MISVRPGWRTVPSRLPFIFGKIGPPFATEEFRLAGLATAIGRSISGPSSAGFQNRARGHRIGPGPFRKNACTMLIAAGFDSECLVLRDTARPGWLRGLNETAAVLCDSLTAEALSSFPRLQ
jgi:hypothetical protein